MNSEARPVENAVVLHWLLDHVEAIKLVKKKNYSELESLETESFDNLRELFQSAARELSKAGNNEENQGDDQLGRKVRRKLSSSALVTGSGRSNKVCELKKIIRDSNLSK